MKKIALVLSFISLAFGVLLTVMNFRVLFGKSYVLTFAMFSMIRNGSIMGFFGNVLGLLATSLSFLSMGFFGLMLYGMKQESSRKPALISGAVVSLIAVISLIGSMIGKTFTIGDLLMLLLPAAYTFITLQTVDT